jgi:hypothetical protein
MEPEGLVQLFDMAAAVGGKALKAKIRSVIKDA